MESIGVAWVRFFMLYIDFLILLIPTPLVIPLVKLQVWSFH